MATTAQAIDQAKLDLFMGRFVTDLGAAMSAALVVIGDKLGLYRAMGDGEPLSAEELARRTRTDARYVREWLSNQAAGGYVSYDPARDAFFPSPEQSLALAQEGSPAFVPGAFQVATALTKDEDRITEAFRDGSGVGWHEHHHDRGTGTSCCASNNTGASPSDASHPRPRPGPGDSSRLRRDRIHESEAFIAGVVVDQRMRSRRLAQSSLGLGDIEALGTSERRSPCLRQRRTHSR